ncbi:helix-turn-helix transcriptional regulator [Sinorhizobium numidicum]|uniref:Helix-turn-helix transcriptional regulator n=1 Tax=Sinorhizobium numidicum TaxID=680248 RepID=A0ABY8D3H8_9HYPH|nr:helix-turn-helix transcriptional regulator [Sinorhizobium numidicum]WEX78013.1 helix-turn-helix transcriptional regulator [Sinorhizobium numidicum]WEX84672.1 helix-turn-helix transcriptional regulator [Sinorhizobium numidicum]
MGISRADAVWSAASRMCGRGISREQLIRRLGETAERSGLGNGLAALTEYVGAAHYLLARHDLSQQGGLDCIVCSDWPFDIVRRLSGIINGLNAKTTELEKCLGVLQPCFLTMPDDIDLPRSVSRSYCATTFNVGRSRFSLMLLFPEDVILSQEGLRDVALLAGYIASLKAGVNVRHDREFELTERELECLFWIAEGKTSEEIAVILGISRNTINNYITSVMRKTATRTRSEAIAHAVRNNLV